MGKKEKPYLHSAKEERGLKKRKKGFGTEGGKSHEEGSSTNAYGRQWL